MILNPRKIILDNGTLKVISFIIGSIFWYIVSQSHTSSLWLKVPLCFHQTDIPLTIEAPESISINIAGKKCDLRSIDLENLAIHINPDNLSNGHNALTLTNEILFLPEQIKLLHWKPLNIVVNIIKETKVLKS